MGYRINYCMPSSFLVVYKYLSSTKYYYVDNGKYGGSSRNNTKYRYDCKSYTAFQDLLNMKASQVKSEADLKTSIFDSEKLCDAFPQLVKAAYNSLKKIIKDPSLIKSYGYTYTIQVEKKSKEIWAWNYTIPKNNNRWLEDEFKKALGSKSISRTLNIHKFDDKTLKKLRDFDKAFGESIVGYTPFSEPVTSKDQLINDLFINIVELYFTYLIETTNTTLLTTQGSKYSVSEYVAGVIPDNASFCCEPFGRTGAITIFAKKFDGGILSEPQPAWHALIKAAKECPYEFLYAAMTYPPTRALHDYLEKRKTAKGAQPYTYSESKTIDIDRVGDLYFLSRTSVMGRDNDTYRKKNILTYIKSMLKIFYYNNRLKNVTLFNKYAQFADTQHRIEKTMVSMTKKDSQTENSSENIKSDISNPIINKQDRWLCFIDSPYISTQPYTDSHYREQLPYGTVYDLKLHRKIVLDYEKLFKEHYLLLSHSQNEEVRKFHCNEAQLYLIGHIKEQVKKDSEDDAVTQEVEKKDAESQDACSAKSGKNGKTTYPYTDYYANQNLVDWLNKNKPRENNLKWGDINNIPELKDIPEVKKTTEAQASKTKSPTKNN